MGREETVSVPRHWAPTLCRTSGTAKPASAGRHRPSRKIGRWSFFFISRSTRRRCRLCRLPHTAYYLTYVCHSISTSINPYTTMHHMNINIDPEVYSCSIQLHAWKISQPSNIVFSRILCSRVGKSSHRHMLTYVHTRVGAFQSSRYCTSHYGWSL